MIRAVLSKASTAPDCEQINAKTGDNRLAVAKTIELTAGKTIF